jgi:hypothetical protein
MNSLLVSLYQKGYKTELNWYLSRLQDNSAGRLAVRDPWNPEAQEQFTRFKSMAGALGLAPNKIMEIERKWEKIRKDSQPPHRPNDATVEYDNTHGTHSGSTHTTVSNHETNPHPDQGVVNGYPLGQVEEGLDYEFYRQFEGRVPREEARAIPAVSAIGRPIQQHHTSGIPIIVAHI